MHSLRASEATGAAGLAGRQGRAERRLHGALALSIVTLLGLGAAPGGAASEPGELAEPLEVPRGPGIVPEEAAHLEARERIELGARALRERGYAELPPLAWALLQSGNGSDPATLERALELAPGTPAVRFEAARRRRSVAELAHSVRALTASAPGMLWVGVVGVGALAVGMLAATAIVALISFARSLSLHGHALGHRRIAQDPPVWPGGLLVLGGLALVPLAGVGPALVLGAAGVLAALRQELRPAAALAGALALSGVLLGPGLDLWSRAAALLSADSTVLAVWRIEQGQAMPEDRGRLEAAVARAPGDLLARIGLATLWKREGEVDRALELLMGVPQVGAPVLHARAANLRGILHLARGEVDSSVAAFEDARSIDETAAVLYNLSQAYARGMRLLERSAPFAAARDLDPELISHYTSFEGANLHRFLIEPRVPILAYLRRALDPTPEAAELAREGRGWMLGPSVPDWGWLILPGLALAALAGRRSTITRCPRCERAVCERCVPEGAGARTCVRCAKLFARGARSDPRMRRRQIELDRGRQRRLAIARAALALCVPGAGRVLDGRLLVGIGAALLASTGAALGLASLGVPSPFELGALGPALAGAAGAFLLTLAYLYALLETRRELSQLGGGRP